MNKFILMVLFFFTTIFSSASFAQENSSTTIADVKIGLIKNLQKDGYLSERMAKESVMKFNPQLIWESQGLFHNCLFFKQLLGFCRLRP